MKKVILYILFLPLILFSCSSSLSDLELRQNLIDTEFQNRMESKDGQETLSLVEDMFGNIQQTWEVLDTPSRDTIYGENSTPAKAFDVIITTQMGEKTSISAKNTFISSLDYSEIYKQVYSSNSLFD